MEKANLQKHLDSEKKVAAGESAEKVFFDSITIYEFPMIIGENPACREGCPVRLGGECVWQSTIDLDIYEATRGRRRHGKGLYIDVAERAAM
jgi:hypothetical protein